MSRPLAAVTGASAGIGRAFCLALARRGYDLLVTARDRARLEALAAELRAAHGVAVEVLAADLARDDDTARVAERLRAATGLALLVNNAGFGTKGRMAETDPAGQEAMLRVHVLATSRLTQAALPALLRTGRHARAGVINVASIAGFLYSPGNVNYCATKAYLITFSEGLAAELAGTNVGAQALCPGFTRSEFHQRMLADARDIPGPLWLSAPKVVEASLDQWLAGGPVICVPDWRYKLLAGLARVVPRALIGRLIAWRRVRRPASSPAGPPVPPRDAPA